MESKVTFYDYNKQNFDYGIKTCELWKDKHDICYFCRLMHATDVLWGQEKRSSFQQGGFMLS